MTNAQHTNVHKVKDYATWRVSYNGHEKNLSPLVLRMKKCFASVNGNHNGHSPVH